MVSSVSAPPPAMTNAVPQAPRPTPLDLSTATVRDAARSSASASNDDLENPAPAAPSKAFKEWLPPCRPLLAVARLVALVAVCATDHCSNSGSALDDSLPVRPAPIPRTAATCTSHGIKLW